MRLPRRVFLNPCDYLLYTDHVIRMRDRQGANIAYMCMDIDGSLNRDRMRRSIAIAMTLSPATLARLRMSIFGGWPHWKLPRNLSVAAELAVEKAYRFVEVAGVADGELAMTGESPVDFREGPQICMTHYALPNGTTRLCIRWPHWLMDAAGTLTFLSLWAQCYDALDEQTAPMPQSIAPHVNQWRPLKGVALSQRWRVLRSQPKAGALEGRHVATPCDDASDAVREHRVLHRYWDADAMEHIRKASKRIMPAGPARITRYLAVSVLRALDALCNENHWGGDAYRITLPMRMRSLEPEDELPELRFGNYLVSPLLVFDRTDVSVAARLPESLTQQLQAYLDAHGDLAQWTLMSLAALLPFPAHRWIFSSRMFKAHFSSGFSFYGEHHPPLRSVGGLPITNLWGGGPTTIPPGMNPVFSRFDKSLNLALTYSWPIVSDEIANRYVELIQREALG